MHCDDGKDYSVFAVLPPYNTIHTHLIDNAGKLVIGPTGYTVTYQAIADPLTNTMNTSSVLKTNFWQFAAALGFGALANDVGLKGFAMPGPGNTPQGMTFSTTDNTWVATGIPMIAACVMLAGCEISVSTPPSDSPMVQTRTRFSSRLALPSEPVSNVIMEPKPDICRHANSYCGWLFSPG